jgi:hypothetical protein
MQGTRITSLVAIALAFGLARLAAAQDGFGAVGAEIDDSDGYVLHGAIGGSFTETTRWDLGASRAETSTTASDLSTTAYDGSIYHDFGSVGLRVRLGGWADDALVQTSEIGAAVDFHGDSWSFALETELRQSDFESISVDRTITLRDGSPFLAQGRADCSVDNTGLGARLSLSNETWRFSVNGMGYDYDGFSCAFTFPVLNALRRTTRGEFVQIADRLTDALSLGAARRLVADNSLLDSRFGLSLSRLSGLRTYTLYYDATEDAFLGRSADTLSGGIEFLLRSGHSLEIYTGVTDYETRSSIAFLGFSLLILP